MGLGSAMLNRSISAMIRRLLTQDIVAGQSFAKSMNK
jgi:hypothetical protein